MSDAPIPLLYEIHDNLVALESVLAEAERSGVSSTWWAVTTPPSAPGRAKPAELLETLPAVGRIHGNVERWLRDEPEVPAGARPLVASAVAAARFCRAL
jgi:hypothetical protein